MAPSWELCSPDTAIAHPSFLCSFRPLPAFTQSMTKPQAVPLSRVLSQMQVFSPAPLKDCSFDPFFPSVGGSHLGCTQERLLDPAAASALRLQPGASPPQKKFAR